MKLEEGFLWIDSSRKGRRTKSGKGRNVPMTRRLEAAMRNHFAEYRLRTYNGDRTEWVFHHEHPRRKAKAGDRIKCLRRSFLSAAVEAEVPGGFVQHDLRHRRATTWLGAGKSPALVQEAMGHAQIETTMGYSHLAREHLRALVAPDAEPQLASARSLGGSRSV